MPQRRKGHNTKLVLRTSSALLRLLLILASSSSSSTFYSCHAFTTRPAAYFVAAPTVSSTVTVTRIPDTSRPTTVRVDLFSSIAAQSVSSSTTNNKKKKKKFITSQTGNKRLAGGMAAMTGWADVMLHAQLGTFCTMMTGNALWLAKAVSECQLSKMVYYTSVILAYCSGLALYRILQVQSSTPTKIFDEDDTKKKKKKNLVGGRRRPRFLETMAGLVAALFVTADLCLVLSTTTTATINTMFLPLLQKWIPACLLATGFAMVNGVGSDFTGGLTFVVTGHLTKFTQTLVDTPRSQWKDLTMMTARSPALAMNLVVLGGFLAGALWGNIVSRQCRWITANFTWVGLILSGLFLWKDSLLRQAERGVSMDANDDDDDSYQKTSKLQILKQSPKVLFQKPASDEEEVVTISSTTTLGVPSSEVDDPVVMSSTTTTTTISSAPPDTAASTAVEEDVADYSEFATELVTSAAAQNVNATMQLLLLENVVATRTTNSTRSSTSFS